MPNVIGAAIGSTSSKYTTATVTAMTCTPRADQKGTAVSLTLYLNLGPSTGLYTHSSDVSIGRVFTGTINGHNIGLHVIKQYNRDRWELGSKHTFYINFNIPYISGTVYCNFKVQAQRATGNWTTQSCIFNWPTNTYTIAAPAGVVSGVPTNLKYNGYTGQWIVANMTGSHSFTWTAPAGGTGGVKSYNVYYSYGSGWVHVGNTTATNMTFNLANYSISRGNRLRFGVRSNNLYGSSSIVEAPYVQLALAPTTPASLNVAAQAKYTDTLTFSWPASTAGNGSISHYIVQVRHQPKGGSWSAWAGIGNISGTSVSTRPKDYTAFTVAPGSTLQYRIAAVNTYSLQSGWRESGYTLLKGGVMRVKVNGSWREGTAWIKVGGVWKEAVSVHVRAGGAWRESA